MNKKQSCEIHAEKRLQERYGLKYSQFLDNFLKAKINNRTAILRCSQSGRVKIYDIIYKVRPEDSRKLAGQVLTIRAVYDKIRKCFVTFLTEDMEYDCRTGS